MIAYKRFWLFAVCTCTVCCFAIAIEGTEEPRIQQIWVNHYRPFTPASNKQELCLLIKDARLSEAEPWEIYSGSIEGFNYEWGKITKLQVSAHTTESGQTEYRQLAILEQKEIAPGTVFSISVDLKGEQNYAEVIQARAKDRFKIVGVPLFEASNSLFSERLLKMLGPEDSLRLDLMHTQESDVPLTLTEAKVNGLPLPNLSHMYLVIGITIIAAIGLMRRPARRTNLARHYRPRHA